METRLTVEELVSQTESCVSEYLNSRNSEDSLVLLADRKLIFELAALIVKSIPEESKDYLVFLRSRLLSLRNEITILGKSEDRGVLLSGHLQALLNFIGELEEIANRELNKSNSEEKLEPSLAISVWLKEKNKVIRIARDLSVSQVQLDLDITLGKELPPSQSPVNGLASGIATLAVAFSLALE